MERDLHDDDEVTGFDVEVRAGLALPGNAFEHVVDPGATVGAGVAYWLNEHLAVPADGDLSFLPDEEVFGEFDTPELRFAHYDAGLQLGLGRDNGEPWALTARAGLGGTTMETRGADDLEGEFQDTYLSTNLGARATFEVSDRVAVGVGGGPRGILAGEEETQRLRETDGILMPFDDARTFPLTAGVEIALR